MVIDNWIGTNQIGVRSEPDISADLVTRNDGELTTQFSTFCRLLINGLSNYYHCTSRAVGAVIAQAHPARDPLGSLPASSGPESWWDCMRSSVKTWRSPHGGRFPPYNKMLRRYSRQFCGPHLTRTHRLGSQEGRSRTAAQKRQMRDSHGDLYRLHAQRRDCVAHAQAHRGRGLGKNEEGAGRESGWDPEGNRGALYEGDPSQALGR